MAYYLVYHRVFRKDDLMVIQDPGKGLGNNPYAPLTFSGVDRVKMVFSGRVPEDTYLEELRGFIPVPASNIEVTTEASAIMSPDYLVSGEKYGTVKAGFASDGGIGAGKWGDWRD